MLSSTSPHAYSLDLESKSVEEPLAVPAAMRTGRMVAALFADGRSSREIANLLGLTEEKVRAVLRMPTTQEALAGLVETQGKDVVQNILRAAHLDTVMRLVELRDGSDSDSVRLGACKELLTRVGDVRTHDELHLPDDPVERMRVLEEEIKRLQQ